jgi:hypothetical protein
MTERGGGVHDVYGRHIDFLELDHEVERSVVNIFQVGGFVNGLDDLYQYSETICYSFWQS